MPEHEKYSHEAHLRQLGHDIRHCLHAIGMGMDVLKTARDDDTRFAELCELMDKEQKNAAKLVDELLDAASEHKNNAPK